MFPRHEWKWFAERGIDVNDPLYGTWWEASDHLHNAKKYNSMWTAFTRNKQNQSATHKEILDMANEIMEFFHQACPFSD